MTDAMKRILRDLCGHTSANGSIAHPPKPFTLIVNEPDKTAARALIKLGIARSENDRLSLVMRRP